MGGFEGSQMNCTLSGSKLIYIYIYIININAHALVDESYIILLLFHCTHGEDMHAEKCLSG